jgi:hypothetical protein
MASRSWIYLAQPWGSEGLQSKANRAAKANAFTSPGSAKTGDFRSVPTRPRGPSDVGTVVCEPHRRISRWGLLLVGTTKFGEAGIVLCSRIYSRFY